eukprot:1393914-Pleurochrysis_carterae.AAC.3
MSTCASAPYAPSEYGPDLVIGDGDAAAVAGGRERAQQERRKVDQAVRELLRRRKRVPAGRG